MQMPNIAYSHLSPNINANFDPNTQSAIPSDTQSDTQLPVDPAQLNPLSSFFPTPPTPTVPPELQSAILNATSNLTSLTSLIASHVPSILSSISTDMHNLYTYRLNDPAFSSSPDTTDGYALAVNDLDNLLDYITTKLTPAPSSKENSNERPN